jgi:hypothetical protein
MYKIKSEESYLNSDSDNSTELKNIGKEKQDKIRVIQWDDILYYLEVYVGWIGLCLVKIKIQTT